MFDWTVDDKSLWYMIVNMQMADNRYHKTLQAEIFKMSLINHEPQSMSSIANEFLSTLVNPIR